MNMKRINLIMGIAALLFLAFGCFYIFRNYLTKDKTPPVITASQDTIECSINATNDELCEGLTASDNRDGDLTSQIMVNTIQVKEDTDTTNKEFNISYIVFDSASNMTTYTRTLVYTDYTSPRFSISSPLRFTSFSDVSENLQDYLTVYDCIEEDLSSQITLELSEEYQNAAGSGSFECHASVTNLMGDTSKIPIVIEVYLDEADSAILRPTIYLTNYIVYLKKGDSFDPEEYLETVTINKQNYTFLDGKKSDYIIQDSFSEYDTDIDPEKYLTPFNDGYVSADSVQCMFKNSVSIDSNVDTSIPDDYIVSYSIKDHTNEQVGNANLIVVVE